MTSFLIRDISKSQLNSSCRLISDSESENGGTNYGVNCDLHKTQTQRTSFSPNPTANFVGSERDKSVAATTDLTCGLCFWTLKIVHDADAHRYSLRFSLAVLTTGCDLNQVRSSFFFERDEVTQIASLSFLCPSSPPFRKVISSHRRLCGEITATVSRAVSFVNGDERTAQFFLTGSAK